MSRPEGLAQPNASKSELKQRLLFVFFALVVFRFGSYVPLPGINAAMLAELMNQQAGTLLSLFNVFSGGALSRASVFTLGIMPYISASIIMQILGFVEPRLQQLKKEGESGRKKITQYTRYLTVVLATVQAISITLNLPAIAPGLVNDPGVNFYVTAVVCLVTGTLFLMWLGEQINERGIGNGISMLIFAGIVAGLPSAIGQTVEQTRQGDLHVLMLLGLAVLVALVTAFVVYVERGQRRIVINYARQQRGNRMMMAPPSHMPLKVNMAGVIPAIFASSIILFPATIAQWFGAEASFLQDIATALSPGQPLYILCFAAGILFFCFFYTALVFNPKETADNLKRSGGFLPGVRPGAQTAEYMDKIMTRLTLVGAMYMILVCLLPEFMIVFWNVQFYFGGTSLLIVVVVVMDFMAQVQAHLMSGQYDKALKKANFKNYGKKRV